MATPWLWARRVPGVIAAVVLVAAACETPAPTASKGPSEPTPAPTAGPRSGGTIYLLTRDEYWPGIDPQLATTPEEIAFFSATIHRSLVSYAYAPDPVEGTRLVPDLATDLGTPSDGGRTWSFTLRDGLTWEDGSALTCRDIAYGVSRTFAPDIAGVGRTHALKDLDIPTVDGWANDRARNPRETTALAYAGPYDENLGIFADRKLSNAIPNDVASFDRAVACDGNTATFHLNRPVGDFNDATTLGMSPVPNPADHPNLVDPAEGDGPAFQAWSSGPYRIESYTGGLASKMVLVRNTHWNRASDPIRKAYPDRWVIQFRNDPRSIDERLIAAEGEDRFALQIGEVLPANLPTIFADADSPHPAFEGRAISALDSSSQYYWMNVEKVPNEKIRQAMMVALDREALRDAWYGGSAYAGLYGDYADGLFNPSIGMDYAPTGIWDTYFGKAVPPSGDPVLARQLIAQSGDEPPTLEWNYHESQVSQHLFMVVQESLGEAGFNIVPGPLLHDSCYIPCSPYLDGDFGTTGWAFEWPDGSTVIPPILIEGIVRDACYVVPCTSAIPSVGDDAFAAGIKDALGTVDPTDRARMWQALNREAVEKAWIIPTFFTRSQALAGTKVGPIYRWPAYASWPYGVMYVNE